jgi:hypothetical protein
MWVPGGMAYMIVGLTIVGGGSHRRTCPPSRDPEQPCRVANLGRRNRTDQVDKVVDRAVALAHLLGALSRRNQQASRSNVGRLLHRGPRKAKML